MDRSGVELQDRVMQLRIQCLCIDTADPAQLAAFWHKALGWRRTFEQDDEVVLEPPEGSPEDGVVPDLLFLGVPEEKAGKNRLHLDLRPTDQAAEVARLERLGASRTDVGQGSDVSWVVMADPDGNEFGLLQPDRFSATFGDGPDAPGLAAVERVVERAPWNSQCSLCFPCIVAGHQCRQCARGSAAVLF